MKFFTYGMNDYSGRLIEISITADNQKDAEKAIRAIMDGNPRAIISIDDGIWLNDYKEV